ncbi:MAG: DUF58 domain-containing protein [Gemmatimonadaceae bacterium]|nr:DUF58 domain-containing protein [Gemmatimonadaceae bacterium]
MNALVRGARALLGTYAPQPRLALWIALLSVAWLLPQPAGRVGGVVVVCALVLAVVVDTVRLPARASLRVTREFPPNVGIGDDGHGHYLVENLAARTLIVRLQDRFPALLRGGLGAQTVRLAPQAAHQLAISATGLVRGTAALDMVGVRVTTTFGLVSATYRYDLKDDVRVIPSMSGVRRFRLLAMQQRLGSLGVRVLRRKGGGLAFASLREYVRGDDPRFIDWKTTSKKDKLITREFTIERSQHVITLVDAGRAMTQLSGEFPRFEHALSAALILTDVAANSGDSVGTLVFDDEVRAFVPAHTSRGALSLIRNAFVPVVATMREPDYASAFRFLATHQRKRALIVFFTDVIDIRASQALLAHVSRSAARHLVLVVALRNDALFTAARVQANSTPAMLYESAAAEEVIQAREAVLHRMRRAGVIVLDVSPATMTAQVVNQYLELKNRGAL